jgi:hypothetical protein
MQSGSDYKLYAKVACPMCLGGYREGMFTVCPYCDVDRMTYIEAPFSTLKENLKENLTAEQKQELIMCLKDEE